jgi:mxaD protein
MLIGLLAAAVQAAPPAAAPRGPVKIEVNADIHTAPAQAWRLVGDFGGVIRWHPRMTRCDVEGSGIGMVRTAYVDGWWIKERLDQRDSKRMLIAYTAIDSSRPNVAGGSASIKLSANGQGSTHVMWRAALRQGTSQAQADAMVAYYRMRIIDLEQAFNRPTQQTN